MKKRGFTLVELIAVIVVLSVVALIAVPIVLNQVEKTKEEAYRVSVRGLFDSVNSYLASNNVIDEISKNGVFISKDDKIYQSLDLKYKNFDSGWIYLDSDHILHAENVSDGSYKTS